MMKKSMNREQKKRVVIKHLTEAMYALYDLTSTPDHEKHQLAKRLAKQVEAMVSQVEST